MCEIMEAKLIIETLITVFHLVLILALLVSTWDTITSDNLKMCNYVYIIMYRAVL